MTTIESRLRHLLEKLRAVEEEGCGPNHVAHVESCKEDLMAIIRDTFEPSAPPQEPQP